MSSTRPAPISEDATVIPDFLLSNDPSFDVVMNVFDNGDFALPSWALDQPNISSFDLSIDEHTFGPILPFPEEARVGEEDIMWQFEDTVPTLRHTHDGSHNVHNDSHMMTPGNYGGEGYGLNSVSTELDEYTALHEQPQNHPTTALVHSGVNTPSSQGSRQALAKAKIYPEKSHVTIRQPKKVAKSTPKRAIREGGYEGPRKRKKKAKPIPEQTWDLMKSDIMEHFITQDKTMKQVKEILEKNFKDQLNDCGGMVEEKQILDRLKIWKIQKNVRPKQREYIIRKYLERANMEGKRPLRFFVRGVEVPSTKIERWLRAWTKARIDSEAPMDSDEGARGTGTSIPSGVFCETVSERSSKTLALAKSTRPRSPLTDVLPSKSDIRTPGMSAIANAYRVTPFTLKDLSGNEISFLMEMFETVLVGPARINYATLTRIFADLFSSSQYYRYWMELVHRVTENGFQRQEYDQNGTNEEWIRTVWNTFWNVKTIVRKTVSQCYSSQERMMVFLVIDTIAEDPSPYAWVDIVVNNKISSLQQAKVFIYHRANRLHLRAIWAIVDSSEEDIMDDLKQTLELIQATPNDGWNTGDSLLRLTSALGKYQMTHLLLEYGAIVENGDRFSCILWAIWDGCCHYDLNLETFERFRKVSDLVIQHGASVQYCVDATPDRGNLLHVPCDHTSCTFGDGHYNFFDTLVRYFVQIGCRLEYRNTHGRTALLAAAYQKVSISMSDYISALVSNGADVHATDNERMGPLHQCIVGFNTQFYEGGKYPESGDLDELRARWKIFLKAGCDPWATDRHGKTAMDYIRHDNLNINWFS